MRVMKFGGTSVRDHDRIAVGGRPRPRHPGREPGRGGGVGARRGHRPAHRGRALEPARRRRPTSRCSRRWRSATSRWSTGSRRPARTGRCGPSIGECLGELERLLAGRLACCASAARARWTRSSPPASGCRRTLMAAMLRQLGVDAEACDARRLIVTDRSFGSAVVQYEPSYARIREHFAAAPARSRSSPASSPRPSTARPRRSGRGGSDYTASLLGVAPRGRAGRDLDRRRRRALRRSAPRRGGVLAAATLLRRAARALALRRQGGLSADRASGAQGGDPAPDQEHAQPDASRAPWCSRRPGPSDAPIRGISSISRVALLRIEGDGMIEVPGTAGRFFKALGEAGINVILISQASSEHSICIAVDPQRAAAARDVVNAEFARERAAGLVDDLVVEEDVSILAIVGVDMCQRPGISGRIFGSLGAAGVNVRAIAQGSSELNISLAIAAADERRALDDRARRVLRPDPARRLSARRGHRGRRAAAPASRGRRRRPTGASRGLAVEPAHEPRAPPPRPRALVARAARRRRREHHRPRRARRVRRARHRAPRVVVDCTASDAMVDLYAELLAAGVDVVTANKKPLAAPWREWQRLLDAQAAPGAGRLYHEATVGAGLPVVRTLADQVATGDRVRAHRGAVLGHALVPALPPAAGHVPSARRSAEARSLGLDRARRARRPLRAGRGAQAPHPGAARRARGSTSPTSA